jgi:hypothetical protein
MDRSIWELQQTYRKTEGKLRRVASLKDAASAGALALGSSKEWQKKAALESILDPLGDGYATRPIVVEIVRDAKGTIKVVIDGLVWEPTEGKYQLPEPRCLLGRMPAPVVFAVRLEERACAFQQARVHLLQQVEYDNETLAVTHDVPANFVYRVEDPTPVGALLVPYPVCFSLCKKLFLVRVDPQTDYVTILPTVYELGDDVRSVWKIVAAAAQTARKMWDPKAENLEAFVTTVLPGNAKTKQEREAVDLVKWLFDYYHQMVRLQKVESRRGATKETLMKEYTNLIESKRPKTPSLYAVLLEGKERAFKQSYNISLLSAPQYDESLSNGELVQLNFCGSDAAWIAPQVRQDWEEMCMELDLFMRVTNNRLIFPGELWKELHKLAEKVGRVKFPLFAQYDSFEQPGLGGTRKLAEEVLKRLRVSGLGVRIKEVVERFRARNLQISAADGSGGDTTLVVRQLPHAVLSRVAKAKVGPLSARDAGGEASSKELFALANSAVARANLALDLDVLTRANDLLGRNWSFVQLYEYNWTEEVQQRWERMPTHSFDRSRWKMPTMHALTLLPPASVLRSAHASNCFRGAQSARGAAAHHLDPIEASARAAFAELAASTLAALDYPLSANGELSNLDVLWLGDSSLRVARASEGVAAAVAHFAMQGGSKAYDKYGESIMRCFDYGDAACASLRHLQWRYEVVEDSTLLESTANELRVCLEHYENIGKDAVLLVELNKALQTIKTNDNLFDDLSKRYGDLLDETHRAVLWVVSDINKPSARDVTPRDVVTKWKEILYLRADPNDVSSDIWLGNMNTVLSQESVDEEGKTTLRTGLEMRYRNVKPRQLAPLDFFNDGVLARRQLAARDVARFAETIRRLGRRDLRDTLQLPFVCVQASVVDRTSAPDRAIREHEIEAASAFARVKALLGAVWQEKGIVGVDFALARVVGLVLYRERPVLVRARAGRTRDADEAAAKVLEETLKRRKRLDERTHVEAHQHIRRIDAEQLVREWATLLGKPPRAPKNVGSETLLQSVEPSNGAVLEFDVPHGKRWGRAVDEHRENIAIVGRSVDVRHLASAFALMARSGATGAAESPITLQFSRRPVESPEPPLTLQVEEKYPSLVSISARMSPRAADSGHGDGEGDGEGGVDNGDQDAKRRVLKECSLHGFARAARAQRWRRFDVPVPSLPKEWAGEEIVNDRANTAEDTEMTFTEEELASAGMDAKGDDPYFDVPGARYRRDFSNARERDDSLEELSQRTRVIAYDADRLYHVLCYAAAARKRVSIELGASTEDKRPPTDADALADALAFALAKTMFDEDVRSPVDVTVTFAFDLQKFARSAATALAAACDEAAKSGVEKMRLEEACCVFACIVNEQK